MSGSQPRVLFIGHEASRTGAPFVLLHFLSWLRQNSKIEFEILLRQGGELMGEFEKLAPTRVQHRGLIANEPVRFLPRLRRKYGLNPPIARQLQRLYPRDRFPLIYSNTVANGEFVSLFSQLGHRTLCHAHEMRFNIEKVGGKPAIEAARVTNGFIAVSAAVSRDLQESLHVPADKITIIHPFGQPSDLTRETQAVARKQIRRELDLNDTDIVVGMCGGALWLKGCDVFLLLAKTVAQLRPARRHIFLWIGVEPTSEEYRRMAHDRSHLGLETTVRLIPRVSNPHQYLSALDVFTLTSREDSFSLVSLEAATLGVPVVCFAGSGGAPELIGLEGGRVVPYLDIDAMAKAILALSDDDNQRGRIGEILRARAQAFTLETQGPKLLAALERSLREL
ncbi:MAG: glycosyltransferase family 4 protein [Opitutaceae bacterium]